MQISQHLEKGGTTVIFGISNYSWTKLCISFEISCFKCVSPCVVTHEIQGAWRPVWSFCSLFCGLHVILLALVGVGPLCFLESKAIAAVHQEIIELSMLQSTDKLYRDADFLSSRAFHLLIVPKLLPNGLPVILSLCLIDHPICLTGISYTRGGQLIFPRGTWETGSTVDSCFNILNGIAT